ncbi:MAG: DegV family protein [Anaerolineales bacterium]
MGVRIVTDTGCDLPPGQEEALGIIAIPFFFHFGMETHRDKQMPIETFLAKAREEWPKTAAPSSEEFARVFQACLDEGNDVLCLTITGQHSATYNSARLAGRDFPADRVAIFDTQSVSIGQGLLVEAAAYTAQKGASLREVQTVVRVLQERLYVYITLDTLEFLVKGGRANRFTHMLSKLLKIRPILTMKEGKLTLLAKARGRDAAKEQLLELARDHAPIQTMRIGHVACEDEAQRLAKELARRIGVAQEMIPVVETGVALATHGGPGTLGVAVVEQAR